MADKMSIGNFSIELLAHSEYAGQRALTWLCTYERFIHAEVMTHRWSRNASSSRAIPLATMNEWIKRDPGMPLHMGSKKSGMQSGPEIMNKDGARAYLRSIEANARYHATVLYDEYGLHKEVVNRYTEPFGWITSVMTMGHRQFFNFLNLRVSRTAHPNIQRLAVNMARLYKISAPRKLEEGQWHMPFIDPNTSYTLENALVWSVARCAWTSYNSPNKETTYEHALKRHDDCVAFKHMTPCEHQLQASDTTRGCVPGFKSYRSMLAGECADTYDFDKLKEWDGRDYLPME